MLVAPSWLWLVTTNGHQINRSLDRHRMGLSLLGAEWGCAVEPPLLKPELGSGRSARPGDVVMDERAHRQSSENRAQTL